MTELEDVVIRGKEEGDLGLPFGHAAVSAALSTAAAPFLPAPIRMARRRTGHVRVVRARPRGAHLPLDVAGGACLGVAIGSAVNLVLGMDGGRPGA